MLHWLFAVSEISLSILDVLHLAVNADRGPTGANDNTHVYANTAADIHI